MDMKKIIEIVNGKTTLNESAVAECGQMGVPTQAPAQEPSMNITMNASGLGNIRDIINMLNAVEQGAQPDTLVPSVDVVASHDSDIEDKAKSVDDLQKIKALAGLSSDEGEEEEESESVEYPNSPDPKEMDSDYMQNDLAGGRHRQYDSGFPGNNVTRAVKPSVAEEIKSDLRSLYNSIKEAWDNYEADELVESWDDEDPDVKKAENELSKKGKKLPDVKVDPDKDLSKLAKKSKDDDSDIED